MLRVTIRHRALHASIRYEQNCQAPQSLHFAKYAAVPDVLARSHVVPRRSQRSTHSWTHRGGCESAAEGNRAEAQCVIFAVVGAPFQVVAKAVSQRSAVSSQQLTHPHDVVAAPPSLQCRYVSIVTARVTRGSQVAVDDRYV